MNKVYVVFHGILDALGLRKPFICFPKTSAFLGHAHDSIP